MKNKKKTDLNTKVFFFFRKNIGIKKKKDYLLGYRRFTLLIFLAEGCFSMSVSGEPEDDFLSKILE